VFDDILGPAKPWKEPERDNLSPEESLKKQMEPTSTKNNTSQSKGWNTGNPEVFSQRKVWHT
jgi:hypothetical protein